MTYAGIKNGVVVQLFTPEGSMEDIPPSRLFHPSLFDEWVNVDAVKPQPESGWTYDGKTFAPPPPVEDLEARLAWARKRGFDI